MYTPSRDFFSDSSSVARVVYVKHRDELVCHQILCDVDKTKSSTLRELMAFDLAIWARSFKASLRVISLTVLADSIYNILIFFAEKM